MTFGNGNGKLDAGETLDLVVNVENSGHAGIANLNAVMTTLSSYVTINNSTGITIPNLSPSQQQSAIFNITISASTPIGTLAEFLDITVFILTTPFFIKQLV